VSKMPESRCRSSAACDGCEEVPGTPQHYHRSSTVVIAFPKRMAPRPAIHLPATLLLGNALGSHQSSESSFSGDERSLNSGLDQAARSSTWMTSASQIADNPCNWSMWLGLVILACSVQSVIVARELAKKSSAALLRKICGVLVGCFGSERR
jgi:hypothetical protein